MIGISYKVATPDYDAYLTRVQNYILSDHNTNREVQRFINRYFTGNGFYTMMNTLAIGLRTLIEDVERNFPELQDCRIDKNLREASELYQFLKYHLVTRGYERGYQENLIKYKLPQKELIESVGINVCPYCNRTFIYTSKTSNGDKVPQAELDHFFSKERFPFLAIAKYNLVPSCSCCNRNGGKFTTDAFDEHLVNPYEIGNADDYLVFRLRVKNANVASLDKMASGLSFKLIAKRPYMQKNINALNLDGLYQHHTDYAAELYFKSIVKANNLYRTSLKGVLRRNGIVLSEDDIKRIIVGNYVTEQDYGKRPLAKMMHDVAEDLGLI